MEFIKGRVQKGFGIGNKLGFPTINLEYSGDNFGVFAAKVFIGDQSYKAAVHVGPRPTFDDEAPVCEVHLLDVEEDFKFEEGELTVELIEQVREVMKFSSGDELREQISRDLEKVQEILA